MNTFKTSDDVVLAYDDDGAGRPVLYLPGYAGDRHQVGLQREALLADGYRVISLDHRGHGSSELPKHGLRVSRLGQDLAEIIMHLDLHDVALLAHSMGTSVALSYFAQSHPQRVSALIAIEQTPKIVNDDTWSHGISSVNWGNVYDVATFRVDLEHVSDEPPMPPTVRAAYDAFSSFPHEQVLPLRIDHHVTDWRDVLPRLSLPALIAVGESSPFYTVEGQAAFAAAIPDSRLEVFRDSGHFPHMNEAEKFNHVLLDFLRLSSENEYRLQ